MHVMSTLAIQGGGLGSNGSGGGNYNYGARVTKYMLQFYKTNPYINN